MIRQPWYRWRFSLPLIAVVVLFLYLAHSYAVDVTAPAWVRIAGSVLFGFAASGGVWLQWREMCSSTCVAKGKTPGKGGG